MNRIAHDENVSLTAILNALRHYFLRYKLHPMFTFSNNFEITFCGYRKSNITD